MSSCRFLHKHNSRSDQIPDSRNSPVWERTASLNEMRDETDERVPAVFAANREVSVATSGVQAAGNPGNWEFFSFFSLSTVTALSFPRISL